jgi:hypothetical protein
MALTVRLGFEEREAVQSAKKLGKSIEEVDKALDSVSDNKFGTDLDKGFDKAKGSMQDFKQEAGQTAAEVGASFDGSAESIAGGFQELAAQGGSAFGPLGAGLGLAAAAGIGLITTAVQGANEETELAKERVADWANAFIEAGGTMLTAGVQAARVQEIITNPEAFAEAETNARNWGVAIETAVQAMSGSPGAINEVTASLDRNKEAAEGSDRAAQELGVTQAGEAIATADLARQHEAGTDALRKLTGEMEAGATRAKILSDANYELIESAGTATVQVDALGNAVYLLPDGTEIMVNAETGVATQNVANFQGDLDGVDERVVTAKVRLQVDDYAWRNYDPGNKYSTVKVTGAMGWE